MENIKSHIEFDETNQQQDDLLSLSLSQPILLAAAPTSSNIEPSEDEPFELPREMIHFRRPSLEYQGIPSVFLPSPRSVADVCNPSYTGRGPAALTSRTSSLYSSQFHLHPRYGIHNGAVPLTQIPDQSEPRSNETNRNTFPEDIVLPSL